VARLEVMGAQVRCHWPKDPGDPRCVDFGAATFENRGLRWIGRRGRVAQVETAAGEVVSLCARYVTEPGEPDGLFDARGALSDPPHSERPDPWVLRVMDGRLVLRRHRRHGRKRRALDTVTFDDATSPPVHTRAPIATTSGSFVDPPGSTRAYPARFTSVRPSLDRASWLRVPLVLLVTLMVVIPVCGVASWVAAQHGAATGNSSSETDDDGGPLLKWVVLGAFFTGLYAGSKVSDRVFHDTEGARPSAALDLVGRRSITAGPSVQTIRSAPTLARSPSRTWGSP